MSIFRDIINFMICPDLAYHEMVNSILRDQLNKERGKNEVCIKNLGISDECKDDILKAINRVDRCFEIDEPNTFDEAQETYQRCLNEFLKALVEIMEKHPDDAEKIRSSMQHAKGSDTREE